MAMDKIILILFIAWMCNITAANKELKVNAQTSADSLTATEYMVTKNQDINGPCKK
jgi:hypothetical protein